MYKVMWLLKRKPGSSMEHLIQYYENRHSVLAKELWAKAGFKPLKYIRKYLHPMPDPMPVADSQKEFGFDVAMEIWLESREQFEKMIEIAEPHFGIISADEEKFLDRERRVAFALEEHETSFE